MTKVSVICFLDGDGTSLLQDSVLKEVKRAFRKRVEFIRIDPRENGEIIEKYGLKEFPSIVIKVDNKVKNVFSGLTQELFLRRALDKILNR